MACWPMMHALLRNGIASLVEHCCVLVLAVELWRASQDFVMQFCFAMECWGDWTVGVGLMMFTFVIRGSKLGVLAHVLRW
jgi:hypothetical protein